MKRLDALGKLLYIGVAFFGVSPFPSFLFPPGSCSESTWDEMRRAREPFDQPFHGYDTTLFTTLTTLRLLRLRCDSLLSILSGYGLP